MAFVEVTEPIMIDGKEIGFIDDNGDRWEFNKETNRYENQSKNEK